jgi:uncharacterized protein YndB with AHSA1/START domain
MKFDIPQYIGAVTRELTHRERDGKPAKVVVATRTYDTEPDDLWDALTNPERIPRWFLPVTGELRLGGRYQLVGNAGGEITRCDRPHHLAITWEMRGEVSWVEVKLTAEPAGGTRLVLEHIAHVPDEFWDQYGPGAVGVGWDLALLGLAQHIAGAPPIDHKEAELWSTSPEGKQYATLASEDWARASIAGGTDAAAARAAAARTTAFYTGAV